ncbi:zinc finger CCHC domain-containing protein 8 homolog isoform X1 [Haemaphysalis longicornis]
MDETAAIEVPGDAIDLQIVDADPSEDGQNNELGATTSSQEHQDAASRVTCSTEDCQDGALGDAKAAGDGQDSTLGNANSAEDCQDGACRDTNSAGDGHNSTPGDTNSAEYCQNGVCKDASASEDCQNGPLQDTGAKRDCQEDDPPAKRQKQEEEDISGGDLFFFDKKGGETTEQPPLYTADFISPEDEAAANEREPENKPQPSFECFNCGGGHLLYDCPKELDSARVAQKRREMARERDSGPKKMRYFEYEMQCQRFQPGKLSEELLDALDVRRNELPCFTYKMRVLGYPPGWLKDAEVEESGLEIYGLDDKNANDGEDEEVQYDPTRLISFPGFNVPMPEGVNDRWVDYEMAPMMQHQLRSEAEKYMNEQAAKRVDQRKKLPATAVRPSPAAVQVVDKNVEDDEIEEGQICGESSAENSPEIGSGSPGTTPVPDSVCTTPSMPLDTACTSSPMDVSPKPDTVENGDCASTEEPAAESPKVRLRKVTLGTPILLGFSEYTSLPPRENFAKGVSEFIPFENLPNTTGRYNKLRQVIDKVRAMRQEDKRQAGDQ